MRERIPFLKALDDERKGRGPGPSSLACLLYAGHTGVSTDGGTIIYGFNPYAGSLLISQLMDGLKKGDAFPGVVRDDTPIFIAARRRGLALQSFQVLFPDASFQIFQTSLDGQRQRSLFTYGFPDGNGDCNCTTWLERIGLPLLTGRMNEFAGLPGFAAYPSRRFGECT